MPPRKIKSIHVENTLNQVVEDLGEDNKEVTYDEVVNLINDEKKPDNPDIEGLEDFIVPPTVSNSVNDIKVEKVKRVRPVKKKQEPVVIPDDKSNDEIEVVENKKEDDNKMKKDENIKVVELSQCEKCGKKLTARTLKYTHNNVCPANENKTPPKPKRVKQSDSKEDIVLDVKEEQHKPPTRIDKIRKRQENFNVLFSNAI